MKIDIRLQPWLDLADALEAFDRFMREVDLIPTRESDQGETVFLDAGAEAAQRMRAIAANRWTWYGWKRDGMRGEVAQELRTFHRWISEGFFYAYEETEAYQEMCKRIENIENKLKQLTK